MIPEDKEPILEVLHYEEWKDLEDGLQMQFAKEAEAEYIVTQNLKYFCGSEIEAVSEEIFCKMFE